MELPSNKLGEVKAYFHRELDPVYGKEEVNVFMDLIYVNILKTNKLIIVKNDSLILESELDAINKVLQRLKRFEPIQYIFGSTFFYGLDIKVNPSVLIPRPETEELVDVIIKSEACHAGQPGPKLQILDIGTGSGCIAIALKKNITGSNVTALDISEDALALASENAVINNVKINFEKFDVLGDKQLPKADIIVSNPPYVTESEKQHMHSNVLDYEPHLALFVTDNDPLQFYKAISLKALKSLNPEGVLFFELNPLYAKDVLEFVSDNGFSEAVILKDISGKNRILRAVI